MPQLCFGGCLQSVWRERRAQALVKPNQHKHGVCWGSCMVWDTWAPEHTPPTALCKPHILVRPVPFGQPSHFFWLKQEGHFQTALPWKVRSPQFSNNCQRDGGKKLRALHEISSFVAADATSTKKPNDTKQKHVWITELSHSLTVPV